MFSSREISSGEELIKTAQKGGAPISAKASQEHPHCFRSLHVILGVTNPSNLTEQNVQVVGYEKKIHHPYFSITSIENNLMLIKLNKYVELNDYVSLAGLPNGSAPEDTACTVSTWAYNLCDVCECLQDSIFSELDILRPFSPLGFCNSPQSRLLTALFSLSTSFCPPYASRRASCNLPPPATVSFCHLCFHI